jgi:hypothetical protein
MSFSAKKKINKKERGFFQRCLCCCFNVEDDDDVLDDAADEKPLYIPSLPPSREEIEALQEEMRQGDEKRRLEAAEKEKQRKPTSSETAIRNIKGLGHVDVRITEEELAAWGDVFKGHDDLTPEYIVDVLAKAVRFDVADNLMVQVNKISDGIMLTINCKQPDQKIQDKKIPEKEIWMRENCQMSLTRKITRGEDGEIIMEDERTDMRGGGCKDLYKTLLPMYQQMGVKKVTMDADDIGSYAWVRYGFRPDKDGEKSWATVRQEMERRLRTMEEENSITPKTAGKVRALLKNDDPNTIEDIADLNIDIPEAELGEGKEGVKKMKLGFRLLQKNMWHGTLDLEDEDVMDELRKYIDEEKK